MRAKRNEKQHACSFCKNESSIKEGYNPKTKQCYSCDCYDRDEIIRKAERDRQQLWWETEGKRIHFYIGSNFLPPKIKSDF